jgi:hypothetical protein
LTVVAFLATSPAVSNVELNSVSARPGFELPLCPQCGCAFAILMPEITEETKSDNLCPDCSPAGADTNEVI